MAVWGISFSHSAQMRFQNALRNIRAENRGRTQCGRLPMILLMTASRTANAALDMTTRLHLAALEQRMSKATRAGISLTEYDASIAKAMLARGDRQSDIAAYFGVNGGRIAEIAIGDTFWWVKAAFPQDLPPPGPYVVRDLLAAIGK